MSQRSGKKKGSTPPNPYAELERHIGDEPLAAEKAERLDSQVRVTFYHFRKRLIDPDNLSGKAVLDGIVRAGILADDTSVEIKEITHKQFKAPTEETVVVIEEIDE